MSDFARDLLTDWHFWFVLAVFNVASAGQHIADAIQELRREQRRARWEKR